MATLSDLYTHLKTLCEQWFYNKSTMDTYLGGKVDKETGKGLSSNDYTTTEKNKLAGIEAQANKTVVDTALSSTSTNPLQNKAINTALSNKADSSSVPTKTSDLTNDGADGTNVFVANNDSRLSDARTPTAHNQASSTITDSNTYSNIGNSSGTQDSINSAIDTKLGQLSSIDALVMVDSLGTASASTMGKLYVINENSKINFYWTKRSGTSPSYTYAWEKMDTDILDELVVNWSDVQGKPSTFTPSSHTHGQINNDGTITASAVTVASADNILITDADDNDKIKRVANLSTDNIIDPTAHNHIGSNANDQQSTINTKINNILNNKAPMNHYHGYINHIGQITQTVTNGGNLVVTNSGDTVGVQSLIDVADGLVQSLITYGTS